MYWDKRADLGDPDSLWFERPDFLGRLVIRVIKSALLWADPSASEGMLPHVGTHNLRKFALSLASVFSVQEPTAAMGQGRFSYRQSSYVGLHP